jgi:hypothetical protein
LERKIGQQQLDLDFFSRSPRLRRGRPLRHVREQRPRQGGPGETTSA